MNRIGDRGFKMVANHWMRDQKRKGDGLEFMRWVYRPGFFRRMIWPIARFGMLRNKVMGDGRRVLRMPFRGALKRDVWEPSQRASEIGEQWKAIQGGGGGVSFSDSDA